jgi:hypothetical protein
MSDEPKQIFTLMAKVMAEVNNIGKTGRNTQQNYAFRGIDEVMGAFHGPLARNGVFFVPEVMAAEQSERQTKSGGTLIYTIVDAAFTFYAPDGSSVTARTRGEAMDSGDKSTNKAMSAALKYALLQTFCVPVEAADDADNETHEVTAKGLNAVSRSTVATRQLSDKARKDAVAEILNHFAPHTDEAKLGKMAVKLRGMSDAEVLAALENVKKVVAA